MIRSNVAGRIRGLAARVDRLRFVLWDRRRHDATCMEHIDGVDLIVLPGVLNPALFRTGPLLADAVLSGLKPGAKVLDMGAGSGVVSLRAAANGARATAVDLNPQAARAVRLNAELNRLEVDVHEGDLFTPLPSKARFDVIAFNPPFFAATPAPSTSPGIRRALYDQPGLPVLDRFLNEVSDRLEPQGRVLVACSTTGALSTVRAMYADHGFRYETVLSKERVSERLVIDALSRDA